MRNSCLGEKLGFGLVRIKFHQRSNKMCGHQENKTDLIRLADNRSLEEQDLVMSGKDLTLKKKGLS